MKEVCFICLDWFMVEIMWIYGECKYIVLLFGCW